jgi:hypothetical protein
MPIKNKRETFHMMNQGHRNRVAEHLIEIKAEGQGFNRAHEHEKVEPTRYFRDRMDAMPKLETMLNQNINKYRHI